MRKERKYIYILVASLLLFVMVQYYAPRPLDWRITLSASDKIPYGAYILHDLLPTLFSGKISTQTISFYEDLTGQPLPLVQADSNLDYTEYENDDYDEYDENTDPEDEYIVPFRLNEPILSHNGKEDEFDESDRKLFLILAEKFAPDSIDAHIILSKAEAGAHIFIATHDIKGVLADSLGVEIYDNYTLAESRVTDVLYDSAGIQLLSQSLLAPEPYYYKSGTTAYHIASAKVGKSLKILGTNTLGAANFIRIGIGRGAIWLHSCPLVFTNYNMLLRDNASYVAGVFSYLPNAPYVVWDEYYKTEVKKERNLVRFILSDPALSWAWRIALMAVIILGLFGIRRRQRAVPIIEAPPNDSLVFTTALSRLYYLNGNHKNIAQKKITYFMEHLRSAFYIDTSRVYPPKEGQSLRFPDEFIDILSKRSAVDKKVVHRLLKYMELIDEKESISEERLMEVNQRMEEFYALSRKDKATG